MRLPFRSAKVFVDEEQRECVSVPLARSRLRAVILRDDYEALRRDSVSEHWHLNASSTGFGYVKCYHPERGMVTIAREILGLTPGDGRWARHHNGNLLDLRRGNLFAIQKRSEFRTKPPTRRPRTPKGCKWEPPHLTSAPVPFEDERGVSCLLVKLRCGSEVKIEQADYGSIVANGLSAKWILNSNGTGTTQVKAHHAQRGCVSVAREVLGLLRGDGRRVKLVNGDPLDLRRCNLEIDEPGTRIVATQRRRAQKPISRP